MMKSPIWIAAATFFALVMTAAVVFSLMGRGPSERGVAPVVSSGTASIGGPFTLTDHQGRTVSESLLDGKLTLIYFGYTFCPDVCPTTLQTVGEALDLMGDDGSDVQGLFISVDPERDTPEVLADYVPHFHDRIIGLTGTPDQVATAAKVYRVYFAKAETDAGDDYLMDHSSILYVMGPDGKYLTHIAHGATPEAIAETLRDHI